MLMLALVFGTMFMAAKYLSGALPKGFWYGALATIICMMMAPLIGFVAGTVMLASGPGGDLIKPGEYLLDGMKNGTLAMLIAPFAVVYYRRKSATTSAPAPSAFENLKRT